MGFAMDTDIRAQITAEIVKRIEEGGMPPWRKGWTSGCLHFNAATGRPYQGVNQVILSMAASMQAEKQESLDMQSRTDPRWLTFKQAESMGVQVRKGEHGTRIVKMVEVDRRKAQAGGEEQETLAEKGGKALVMKAFTVFNASQIEGMAPMPEREPGVEPSEAVEAVVWGLQDTGMKLNFGSAQPAYYPRTDEIRMPQARDFHSLDDYHATLLHECSHATGHIKRLSRLHMDSRFGTPEYAKEELRAELASAMMVGELGLPLGPTMIEQHAAYLSSWLEALRRDKNEIFRAAADAQKICNYLSERALEAKPRRAKWGVMAPSLVREQVMAPVDEESGSRRDFNFAYDLRNSSDYSAHLFRSGL